MLARLNARKIWTLVPIVAFIAASLMMEVPSLASAQTPWIGAAGDHHMDVHDDRTGAAAHDHEDCCEGTFCHLTSMIQGLTGDYSPTMESAGGDRARVASSHRTIPPNPPPTLS